MSGFPNYWLVTGLSTSVGTTSLVFMIEESTRFILECIELSTPHKLVGVTAAAMSAYNREIQAALGETVCAHIPQADAAGGSGSF